MLRDSIFFKLNILFAIALITTLISAFSIIVHIAKRDQADLIYKSRIILREMRVTRGKPIELFNEFNLVEIEDRGDIIEEAKAHYPRKNLHSRYHILHYKGSTYLHIKLKYIDILLKDRRNFWDKFYIPILIFLSILILLIVMYSMLRKSLIPIKGLQRDIINYGDGIFPLYQISQKKDEISLVSNAFYKAIEKSKTLLDSRQLFIRNIFHELNTPITKGKILAEIVEDKPTKEMLDSIFTRLSILIEELAQIEKITTKEYQITPKEVRVVELIDQARDWLYIDEKIETNISDERLFVDFYLMSIVFKNLIDNALKYGTNLSIIYSDGGVLFRSKADKLEYPIEHYKEPFRDSSSHKKGFGLGLYIIHEILDKHNMRLSYQYIDGYGVFVVE